MACLRSQDLLLAEFVVRGTRGAGGCASRVRFRASFPSAVRRVPSPRYYSVVVVRSHRTVRKAGSPHSQERRAGPIAQFHSINYSLPRSMSLLFILLPRVFLRTSPLRSSRKFTCRHRKQHKYSKSPLWGVRLC